jgi:hypothetical protein
MKKNKILMMLFILITPLILIAQEEPELPEPPAFSSDYLRLSPQLSEQEENILLQKLDDELKNNLLQLKTYNKEEYLELLRESQFRNMHYPFATNKEKEMIQRERKIFELEVATQAISAKYNSDKSADKSKLKSQLSSTISELFDLKEMNRQAQVTELENELSKLKKELSVRSKNKEEIIRRRVQELLGEADFWGWD